MDEETAERLRSRLRGVVSRHDDVKDWRVRSMEAAKKANATGLLATLVFCGGFLGTSENPHIPIGAWLTALVFLIGLGAWAVDFVLDGVVKMLTLSTSYLSWNIPNGEKELFERIPVIKTATDVVRAVNLKGGTIAHVAAWTASALGVSLGMGLLLFYAV